MPGNSICRARPHACIREMVIGMTREDEIMAGYLLKGGKMLSTSCPSCGCPLFEVKGKTLCVVCAENRAGGEPPGTGAGGKRETPPGGEQGPAGGSVASPQLEAALEETIVALCARIRDEKDPRCVATLMEAVSAGIAGLNTLRSR